MLAAGRPFLRTAPLLSFLPGAAIMATVLAFHVLGERLQRRLSAGGKMR